MRRRRRATCSWCAPTRSPQPERSSQPEGSPQPEGSRQLGARAHNSSRLTTSWACTSSSAASCASLSFGSTRSGAQSTTSASSRRLLRRRSSFSTSAHTTPRITPRHATHHATHHAMHISARPPSPHPDPHPAPTRCPEQVRAAQGEARHLGSVQGHTCRRRRHAESAGRAPRAAAGMAKAHPAQGPHRRQPQPQDDLQDVGRLDGWAQRRGEGQGRARRQDPAVGHVPQAGR